MGNKDFCGENSQNGENSNGERPFKKARYAWQVKGKYHLKDNNENIKESVSEEKNIESEDNKNPETGESRHEPSSNTAYSDRHCINKLLTESDSIFMYVENEENDNIPVSMVKPNPKNSDYYLKKWQARQIAKGFVDNTINRVLENWMVAPFDATDFVENCENGGLVEDEGILMAIQSHGLQSVLRKTVEIVNTSNDDKVPVTGWKSIGHCNCSQKRVNVPEDKETELPFHRRNNLYYEEQTNSVSQSPQTETEDVCLQNKDNECHMKTNDEEDDVTKSNENLKSSSDSPEHIDFLNAAVSFAIQNKGLISHSSDTGADTSG